LARREARASMCASAPGHRERGREARPNHMRPMCGEGKEATPSRPGSRLVPFRDGGEGKEATRRRRRSQACAPPGHRGRPSLHTCRPPRPPCQPYHSTEAKHAAARLARVSDPAGLVSPTLVPHPCRISLPPPPRGARSGPDAAGR
jgi:hypothetical protein